MPMTAPPARELRPGDHIVYLFDREAVTEEVLATIQNETLTRMARQWLREYAHRFFLTVARNYQPIAGSSLHRFDTHDDSVLFLDRPTLLAEMPRLAQASGGLFWVVLATDDMRREIETALR